MMCESNKIKFILVFLIVVGICVFLDVNNKPKKTESIINYNISEYCPSDTYNEVLSYQSETSNVYYNHEENDNYLECGIFQYYYAVYDYYDTEDDCYYFYLGSWVDISPVNSSSEYYSVNKNMYQSFSISANEYVDFACLGYGPLTIGSPYDLSFGTLSFCDNFSCDIDFTNYKKQANENFVNSRYKCNEDTKVYTFSIFRIEDFSQYGSLTFNFDFSSEASFYVNGPLLENYNVETDDDLNNISTAKEFSYTYGV